MYYNIIFVYRFQAEEVFDLFEAANSTNLNKGESAAIPKPGVWVPLRVGETVNGGIKLAGVKRNGFFF